MSFFCFHLISMSSTICNMLLYGWLNEDISSHSAVLKNIRIILRKRKEGNSYPLPLTTTTLSSKKRDVYLGVK